MALENKRIHRLLWMIAQMQTGSGLTLQDFACEFGVAPRTVFRDLAILEQARIPCPFDRKTKTYRIPRQFFVRPIEFTVEEALALAALGEHVGGMNQIPFTNAAAMAAMKIRGELPEAIRREVEEVQGRLVIRLGPAGDEDGARHVFDTMRHAITDHLMVESRYEAAHSGHDGSAERTFFLHPYTLFYCQRAWYVIGYHSSRKDLRSMKLSRFTVIRLTDRHFSMPRDFSMDAFLGDAWRMMRGPRRFEVELWFDASFAENIADTHWHRTQEIEWQKDDSLVFRCKVDGLDEIVWWVLGMGPHCIVRRPVELAQRVRELARGILERYPA